MAAMRTRPTCLLRCCLVLLCLVPLHGEAGAAAPDPGAPAIHLYFQRDGKLWRGALDGSGAEVVSDEVDAVSSSDGRLVAYTHNTPEGGRKIGIHDVPPRTRRLLAHVPGDNSYGPLVSPKGDKVVFNHFNGSAWEIGVAGLGEASFFVVSRRAKPAGGVYSPAWASKGDAIYFQDLQMVWEVGLNGMVRWHAPVGALLGGHGASLSSSARIAESPAGDILALDADGSDRKLDALLGPAPVLFLVDKARKVARRLTAKGFAGASPCWSRDGQRLYFNGFFAKDVRSRKGEEPTVRQSIYSVRPDGADLRRMVPGAAVPWLAL